MKLFLALADSSKGGIIKLANSEFIPLPTVNYLTAHDGYIYAVLNPGSTAIAAIRDGKVLKTESGRGKNGCHLAISPGGKYLYAANYGDGSVDEFTLEQALPVWKRNWKLGEKSRAHHVSFTDDGELSVVDLGMDKIWFFSFTDASGVGSLISSVAFVEGAGPRHLVWLNSKTAAVVNELDSTMSIIVDGAVTTTLSTTDSKVNLANYPGAIRLSPCGKYIIVTNRGENSLAVFEKKQDQWQLNSTTPCGGVWPRDCYFSNGKLYVANERSNNIAIFSFSNGVLQLDSVRENLPSPMSFLEME